MSAGEGRSEGKMANVDLNECFRVADQVAREAGRVSASIIVSVKTKNIAKKARVVLMKFSYICAIMMSVIFPAVSSCSFTNNRFTLATSISSYIHNHFVVTLSSQ